MGTGWEFRDWRWRFREHQRARIRRNRSDAPPAAPPAIARMCDLEAEGAGNVVLVGEDEEVGAERAASAAPDEYG